MLRFLKKIQFSIFSAVDDNDGIHLELPSRADIERIVLRARKDVDADFSKLGIDTLF